MAKLPFGDDPVESGYPLPGEKVPGTQHGPKIELDLPRIGVANQVQATPGPPVVAPSWVRYEPAAAEVAVASKSERLTPIPPSRRMALQSRANEEMAWARNNREDVFAAYGKLPESKGGRIINGDLFVTMLPVIPSNPSQVHRLDLTDMNYLAMDMFEKQVSSLRPGANTVALMVGAPGAGKTTLAKRLLDQHPEIHTVLDSNGANWEALKHAMNTALQHGHNVDIIYVGGDLKTVVGRTVSRCQDDQRVVPASTQADLHRMSPINFMKAMREIADERVSFAACRAETHAFVEDPAQLANEDLRDPRNNLEGIRNILKEAIHDRRIDTETGGAFNE